MPNSVWRESLNRSILDLVEDKASIGSWSWDIETGAMDWSIGVYRILGVPPSQAPNLAVLARLIEGSDASMLLHPNPMVVAKFLADRKLSIRREDGEFRTIHSHGKLVSVPGAQSQFVGALLDITESRLDDELFLLREALLDSMRNLFGVTIWQMNADGSAADLLEWRGAGGEGVQSSWSRLDLVHPEDVGIVEGAWAEARENKRSYNARFRLRRGDGYVGATSQAVSLLSGSGEVRGWIGFTKLETPEETRTNIGTISSAQVRAARGLLDWTGRQLAEKAKVSFSTIRRLEKDGPAGLSAASLAAIEAAFRVAGVTFVRYSADEIGILARPPVF